MELYQLQSFIAVARTGSLSKAAVTRNISLSGISKHIKMLEENVRFPLFTRSVRGMELTEKGRVVLIHAEKVQHNIDCLKALSSEAPQLRLGLNISPDFIELFRLKKLLEDHSPSTRTVLAGCNSGVLLNRLADGDLDLCLAFGEVPGRYHTLFIRKVQMPLMVPAMLRGYPLDLSRECWIVNPPGCPFKGPMEEFWRTQGIHPQATIPTQDLPHKEMVAQGLGIAFLEPQDGLSLLKNGKARQYNCHFVEVDLRVVFLDNSFRSIAEIVQGYIRQRYDALDPDNLLVYRR